MTTVIERVFEHRDFVIINKPPGVPVQNQTDCPGLLQHLHQQYGWQGLHLVHRLDKVTSGIMVLARSAAAAADIGEAFAKRKTRKYYLALSPGKGKKKQGLIAGDMIKRRQGNWTLSNSLQNPAVTQFLSKGTSQGMRVYLLRPWSGKTHQLRVAMKSNSAPILGDARYSGEAADRTYLHAYALQFDYQGQPQCFQRIPEHGEWFQHPSVQTAIDALCCENNLSWPALPSHLQRQLLQENDSP
ncbi:TIGR01621 family pseudouridine synthase [Aestuariibacter halophilus]|uniref:TIGR01621 family pseudouridine synthase n=1 Tax=Fluctibacter halophilus TaxID=226011 RepID=A0ABS8G9D3_9ALTE|nr:TIGR01621 family pseudouridine synthase [Aestuariibacter halophilus]MCC2616731.1 TIGR01621 family pseudouridine synthase [Aestuariibacter halophilus]